MLVVIFVSEFCCEMNLPQQENVCSCLLQCDCHRGWNESSSHLGKWRHETGTQHSAGFCFVLLLMLVWLLLFCCPRWNSEALLLHFFGRVHLFAVASSTQLVRAGTFWPSRLVTSLKPVLNWANVCSRTQLDVFDETSWFLIGRTFLREPSWEYSSNCDEAIFGVQKALLNMFWEHSPYLTNIASDCG